MAVDARTIEEARRQWYHYIRRTYLPYSARIWQIAEVVWKDPELTPEPPEFPTYTDAQGGEHAEY